MKLLIKISGTFVVLVLLLAVVAFFLPKHFHVERSIIIHASATTIYPYLGDLKNWKKWGVWYARDPAMTIDYSASTAGVGAMTEWQSKSQGSGKSTITAVDAPRSVTYRLEFRDFGMSSTGTYSVTPNADGKTCEVASTLDGELTSNPVMRWMGLFMDKLMGPDFDESLAKLKKLTEIP